MSMQIENWREKLWNIALPPSDIEILKKSIGASLKEDRLEKIQVVWVKAGLFRDEALKTLWVGPDLFMQAKTGYIVNFRHNGCNHTHAFKISALKTQCAP